MLSLFPRSDVGVRMLPSHLTGSIIDGLQKKHPVLSDKGSFFVYMSAWRVSVVQIIQGGPVELVPNTTCFSFLRTGCGVVRRVVGLL